MSNDQDDERLASEWYDKKTALMEKSLGPEHDMVMHAIIPYAVGGGLDLYYFPNGTSGTAIATKELSEFLGEGSRNDEFDCYELVMFTRIPLDLEAAQDDSTEFGRIHASINGILNCIARYSETATLNSGNTLEFPEGMEQLGGRCLILFRYAQHELESGQTFGLLAVMEVFRSEMNYSRENGSAELISLLKQHGHYPFSDMDREPVV